MPKPSNVSHLEQNKAGYYGLLSLSFYTPLVEYYARQTYDSKDIMRYTPEKARAVNLAVISHSHNVKKAIGDLRDVRTFIGDKITINDVALLEKMDNVDKLLRHLELLNEGIKKELKSEI